MTPPIKKRVTGRTPTGARLQALREAIEPEPSQAAIAARIGEGQMWLSRRERGKPEPTVDEALLIAEALGYAAELVIVERKQRQLLAGLGQLSPQDASLVLRLMAVLPGFDNLARRVLLGLIEDSEERDAEAVTPS